MNKKILYTLPFLFTAVLPPVNASVVMQGNRVVYDAQTSQKAIKFTNTDNFPYIVQTWVSTTEDGKISNNDSLPFAISPAIFRMQPKQDQVINLLYTDAQKKIDKEQIYYLHFTQVPSVLSTERDKNKLVLIVNSVVKIFLRPTDAAIPHDKMFDFIHYQVTKEASGCRLVISNQSPYYLNSIQLSTTFGSAKKESVMQMMAPESSFSAHTACASTKEKRDINISYINDYGVVQKQSIQEK